MQWEVADYTDLDHVQAIRALMQHYATDPMGGGEALADEILERLPQSLAGVPGAFSVLGWMEGEVVALANCFQGFSTFQCKPLINIHDLVVREGVRGMGIAGQLLQQVEAIAIERGCCKVTLEVLSGNHKARSAYRKSGFAPYQLGAMQGTAQFWEKKV